MVVVIVTVVVIVKYFSKNNMTPRPLMRYVQGSFLLSCDVFQMADLDPNGAIGNRQTDTPI